MPHCYYLPHLDKFVKRLDIQIYDFDYFIGYVKDDVGNDIFKLNGNSPRILQGQLMQWIDSHCIKFKSIDDFMIWKKIKDKEKECQ